MIKQLGTNGGGFFNVNSAMPFENPSGLTNFVELLLILVIPAALTYTYGRMVGSQRQGWAIFSAMFVLFVGGVIVVYMAEQHGTPAQHLAGLHTHAFDGSTGGNMEGKEQRFGIADSALWAAVTTVTSCGAVNAAFESLTGLGGAVPFVNLSFSEVVFGGVGAGLYTMLLYVLLAVFIGGLMVGRTPEYLGKKIQAREIKLVYSGCSSRRWWCCSPPASRRDDPGPLDLTPVPRASPRRSMPTSPRPTTTAPPGPATPASSSLTHPATSVPTGSPSPICSAASS